MVRAELENHEEAARYQKDGGGVLGEKWVGLCVRDDEYRFTGEIVGMKWVDDTEPPQICTEIRSYDKKVTETYCVLDLPAMVITAEDEQVLDVLLEYDPLRTNSTFPATGRPRRRWPSPWNDDGPARGTGGRRGGGRRRRFGTLSLRRPARGLPGAGAPQTPLPFAAPVLREY